MRSYFLLGAVIDASHLEAFFSPFVNTSIAVESDHAIQLASGERIVLYRQTKLLVECDTLAKLAPSTVVRLAVFNVNQNVINWFELGCTWARNACGDVLIDESHDLDGRVVLSALRSRLLSLLQRVFCPMITSLNEIWSQAPYSPELLPTPEVAIRALANHFDTLFFSLKSTTLAPLFATAAYSNQKRTNSSATGGPSTCLPLSTSKLDAIVPNLIDPLFVFATAWAVGGRIISNDLVSTRVDRALRECLMAENLIESVSFPPYLEKSQATIYEFQPMVHIDQGRTIRDTLDFNTPSLSAVQAEKVGDIFPVDFNILYDNVDEQDFSESGNLAKGELPLGFDLTFSGSEDTNNKSIIPTEPRVNQTKVNAPLQTKSQGDALIQVHWVCWKVSVEINQQLTQTVLQNDVRKVTSEAPARLLVETPAQYRSLTMVSSAVCENIGRKGMGVLILGPIGSGKTTIAKRALLFLSESDAISEEASLIPTLHGKKLEVSMCATCNATWLHAKLTAATRGQASKMAPLTLFIDDISVPVLCTQRRTSKGFGGNPRELIRCLLDHQGAASAPSSVRSNTADAELCVSVAALSWKPLLASLRVLATARIALPTLSKRLLRHFWIYELGPLDETILRGMLAPFIMSNIGLSDNDQVSLLLSDALIDTTVRVAESLPSTPLRPDGALRGLHDIFRIIRGVAVGMVPESDRQANSTNLAPLAALFLHECRRVLGDPLRSLNDQVILEERLSSVAAFHFNVGGSAWEANALFRDSERPLVFADFLGSQIQHGQDSGNGASVDTSSNARYEVCRNTTQLRSILDWHINNYNEVNQIAGCLNPLNAHTLLAGDGVVRVARTYHALRQQKNVVMIGRPGDQRPALVTLATHVVGAAVVVAQGAIGGSEDEFAKNILAALRHAVLMAATMGSESKFPRRTSTKVIILISDESLVASASRHDSKSVSPPSPAVCRNELLKTSLDVLQAIVLNGDAEGKLFSPYSNATLLDVERALRAGIAMAADNDTEIDNADRSRGAIVECPREEGGMIMLPATVRAALAANTVKSVAIVIATESELLMGFWRYIQIGYPTLAASFQIDYHGAYETDDDHIASMANVLQRCASEVSLGGSCSQLKLNTDTAIALSRASLAALHACHKDKMASPGYISPSLLLDIADATPIIASKWYLILKSQRGKLSSAISSYNALSVQLNANLNAMRNIPRKTIKRSLIHTSEPYYTTILCLLAVETANWSMQISAIDKRLKFLYADAALHAIDVRLACGQNSPQGRLRICTAAKDSLTSNNLIAAPLTINGATFTYPFEAALYVELADAAIERFVFRTAHTYPGDDTLVSTWRAQDCLPRGIYAAGLALAVKHTIRWPLVIDPNGIGLRWIRAAEWSMNLDVHEASPTTGKGVRAALHYSIAQQCPLLLNVDHVPACCSDANLFESSGCLLQKYATLQRNNTYSSPSTSKFRLYCVATNSYPVLTDTAVITFNVIIFTMDDVGLRDCLGCLSAAALVPKEEFARSRNSLHQATAGVFVAENTLIDFLGNLDTSREINGSKSVIALVDNPTNDQKEDSTNSIDTYITQIAILIKELNDALQEASTSIGTHSAVLHRLRTAFTVGAVGVAAHLATVNISIVTSSFEQCVFLSSSIFLSSIAAFTSKIPNHMNAYEVSIICAFIENATYALSPGAIPLFAVELARSLVIQKMLVSVDLELGNVNNKNKAVKYASSVSKGWRLLLEGPKGGSTFPEVLPDSVTHVNWDYAGALERSVPTLTGLRALLVRPSKNFEWRKWLNFFVLDKEDTHHRCCVKPHLAEAQNKVLLNALLQRAFLANPPVPDLDPRHAVRIIFQAAQDTIVGIDKNRNLETLLCHTIETGNAEKRTFDQVAMAIHGFLSNPNYPSVVKPSKNTTKHYLRGGTASTLPVSILLIGKFSCTQLNRDRVLDFMRSLAIKCGILRVHVIESRPGGSMTMSVLEVLNPTGFGSELGTVFQGQEEIWPMLRNARQAGEWVLVYNVENFSRALIQWLSQLHVESSSGVTSMNFFFSTNVPCLAIKQLQVGAHIKVFRCILSYYANEKSIIKSLPDMNRSDNVTYESFCSSLKSRLGEVSTKYPPDVPEPSIKLIQRLMSLVSTTQNGLEVARTDTCNFVRKEVGARDLYSAILTQIPAHLDAGIISAAVSSQRQSWCTLALSIEAQRHNAVIALCRKHLVMLLGMPPEHQSLTLGQDIEADILAGLTPAPWIIASPHFILPHQENKSHDVPSQLQRWLVSLQIHVEYLRSWISTGHPKCLWLGVLFSPKLYLKAALLDVAKTLGDTRPGDNRNGSLTFVATPYAADVNAEAYKMHVTAGSIVVEGLRLMGAMWNSMARILVAPLSNQVELVCHNLETTPLLLLTPNTRKDLQCGGLSPAPPPPRAPPARVGTDSTALYLCPVYTFRNRKLLLILTTYLPSELKQEHCYEHGVHLLC